MPLFFILLTMFWYVFYEWKEGLFFEGRITYTTSNVLLTYIMCFEIELWLNCQKLPWGTLGTPTTTHAHAVQFTTLHFGKMRFMLDVTVHQKLLCLCKVGSCLCLNSLKVSRYSWVITTTLLWVRGSCRPALDLMGLLWIRKKASALQVVI